MIDWIVTAGVGVGVVGVITLLVWIGAMLLLLKFRLGAKGDGNGPTGEDYHNNAIYRDFSFFYKVTLAIITGVALLACKTECTSIDGAAAGMLIRLAGYLLFGSGLLFSFFIFAHQKSKIERWEKKEEHQVCQILMWQETWMVVAIVVISATFAFGVAPYLA